MTREEVIAELEYYRDTLQACSERAGRLVESLKRTPTAKPAPAMPRDEAGYAIDLEEPQPRCAPYPTTIQPSPAPRPDEAGEFLDLEMESLHVTHDGEKKTFKVKGGAYRKWGVFIWPEVLQGSFNIDPDELQPGLYGFKHKVRILMDGDRPRKVIGLAQ